MGREILYDAFVSYRQGDEAYLEKVKQCLEAKGYAVVDQHKFSGNDHTREAERKVSESRCAIFIFNPKILHDRTPLGRQVQRRQESSPCTLGVTLPNR